jgi:hypothetical protein
MSWRATGRAVKHSSGYANRDAAIHHPWLLLCKGWHHFTRGWLHLLKAGLGHLLPVVARKSRQLSTPNQSIKERNVTPAEVPPKSCVGIVDSHSSLVMIF